MTYYSADVGIGGANQPLSFSPQVVSDSSGNATFNFQTVPNGQIWTGTITVIGAPDSATFTLSSIHVGNDIGQFIGGNNWGPLQLQSGDQLIVTATGLLATTAYLCNFQGTAITNGDPGITYPEAYAHSVTTRTEQILLASGTFGIASGTINQQTYGLGGAIPLNTAYRSIYILTWFTSGTSKPTVSALGSYVKGNQSALIYGNVEGNNFGGTWRSGLGGSSYPYETITSIPNGVDTTFNAFMTFTGTSPAAGCTVHYVIGADLASPGVQAVYSSAGALNQNFPYAPISTYGGFPVENTLFTTDGITFTADPIIVAGASGGTPIPISGSVTTLSGSTTAVTNSVSTPLYVTNSVGTVIEVQGIAGGVAIPISGTVTAQNTSGTPLYVTNTVGTVLEVQGISGGVAMPISGTVTAQNTSGTPLYVNGIAGGTTLATSPQGGTVSANLTLATTTGTQILAAPAAGSSYRIHSVNCIAGAAGQNVTYRMGSAGNYFAQLFPTVALGTFFYIGGLLTTTAIFVTVSTTTSVQVYIWYDLVTTPTIG